MKSLPLSRRRFPGNDGRTFCGSLFCISLIHAGQVQSAEAVFMNKKFDEALNRFTIVAAGIAFSLMIIITTVNVFARFLFSKSFAWSEELTYMFFNWAVFMGICGVYHNQGLISIDAVTSRLPKKIQQKLAVITFAIVAVMNAALTVWGTSLSIHGWSRKTANLLIPYTFIDMCLPLATLIMCYYSVCNMIKEARGQHVEEAAIEDRA